MSCEDWSTRLPCRYCFWIVLCALLGFCEFVSIIANLGVALFPEVACRKCEATVVSAQMQVVHVVSARDVYDACGKRTRCMWLAHVMYVMHVVSAHDVCE